MLLSLIGGKGSVDAVVAMQGSVIVGHAMAADQVRRADEDARGASGSPDGPKRAEGLVADIGIVVADPWQGQGVGSALMRALVARASARGVTSLTMNVLHENRRVLAMIAGHWPDATTELDEDSVALQVRL